MTWKNLVTPNTHATATPGNCLAYVQRLFGAPVAFDSAWQAWENQLGRHPGEYPPPGAIVPLWFEHVGTYGPSGNTPRHKGNWGHVTGIVPGDAIYSSPANPYAGDSFERYANIQQIERAFNARYVGWSEYLNGRQIVARVDLEEEDMTPEQAGQLKAVYDALFKETPTSRGTTAGALRVLGQIAPKVNAIHDAIFFQKPTSRGTPEGVLGMLRLIGQNLGIVKPVPKPEPGEVGRGE